MEEYSMMEMFADPSQFESLSFGEKMAGSGVTMLMGMGITFIVLLLLWGIIAVMSKMMTSGASKKVASAVVPAPAAAPAASVAATAPAVAAEPADEVLAAVIAAAIAAYESGGEVKSDLIVRRIRRVSGPAVSWSEAGRGECVDSRRM